LRSSRQRCVSRSSWRLQACAGTPVQMCRALLLRHKTGTLPRSCYEIANPKDNNADLATQANAAAGVARQRDDNVGSAAHKTVQPSCWHPGDPSKLSAQALCLCEMPHAGRAALPPWQVGQAGKAGGPGGAREAEEAVRATTPVFLYRQDQGAGPQSMLNAAAGMLGRAQVCSTAPTPHAQMPMPRLASRTHCQSPRLSAPRPQALRLPQALPLPQLPSLQHFGIASLTAEPQARNTTARSSCMQAMTVPASHARTICQQDAHTHGTMQAASPGGRPPPADRGPARQWRCTPHRLARPAACRPAALLGPRVSMTRVCVSRSTAWPLHLALGASVTTVVVVLTTAGSAAAARGLARGLARASPKLALVPFSHCEASVSALGAGSTRFFCLPLVAFLTTAMPDTLLYTTYPARLALSGRCSLQRRPCYQLPPAFSSQARSHHSQQACPPCCCRKTTVLIAAKNSLTL